MRIQKLLNVIIIVALTLVCMTPLGVHAYGVSAECYDDTTATIHANGVTVPGVTFYGGTSTFPERAYTAYDYSTGGFVVNSLWNAHSDGLYWEEIGFGRGWHGQDINHFYWAYNHPVNGYFEMKINKNPEGVGTSHTYSIYPLHLEGYQHFWYVRVDSFNTYVGMPDLYTSDYLCTGGEMTSSQSTFSSTTSSSLQYYTSRNQGGATNWPNDNNKTFCVSKTPLNWSWVSYPTSGSAWK
ncbi:MAG: hypothetical protein WC562_00770 [Dehalococcoidia bacterium]